METQKSEIKELKKTQVDLKDDSQVKELSKTFLKDGLWTDVVKSQVDLSIGKVTNELETISKMVSDMKHQALEEKEKEFRSIHPSPIHHSMGSRPLVSNACLTISLHCVLSCAILLRV